MIRWTGRVHSESPSHRLGVLFDSPAAGPLLNISAAQAIGGAELRAVTFAHELARRAEFDVHFLLDHPNRDGGTASCRREGITVHFEHRCGEPDFRHRTAHERLERCADRLAGSVLARLAGIPARRRVVERLSYDVVCCFGLTNRTASVVRSARRTGRRSIVFLTTDRSLDDLRRRGRRDRGVYGELGSLCRFALRKAHAVVVQTRRQQREIERHLGVDARLIRNPIDLASRGEPARASELPGENYALWVGRADTFSKRADICWQLARACPGVKFVAIMNAHRPAMFDQLCASQPANVRLIPFVPANQIEAYYRHATLLVNTSDAEGFPNSFLQAGKYGVPIVSLTVDPDGMLTDHGAGICCHGSLAAMQRSVSCVIIRGADYDRMAGCARRYVRQYHELGQRTEELAALLCETASKPAGGGRRQAPGALGGRSLV